MFASISCASQSLDLGNLSPPRSKKRNDSFLHVRSASGGEERDCFCFGDEKVGRRAGDLRLGCMCLVHYDCLISYIRVSLGDKARLMRTLSVSEDNQITGIICPYYSPHVSQCRFVARDFLSKSFSFSTESVYKHVESSRDGESSKYFLTIDDLENLVTFGAALEKLKSPETAFDQNRNQPLTKEEVKKLKGWLAEESPLRRTPPRSGRSPRSGSRFSRSNGIIPEGLQSVATIDRSISNSTCYLSSQSGEIRKTYPQLDGKTILPDSEPSSWMKSTNPLDRSLFVSSFDTPSRSVRKVRTPLSFTSTPIHQNGEYSDLVICGDCKTSESDTQSVDIQIKPYLSPSESRASLKSSPRGDDSRECFCDNGHHPPSLIKNQFQLNCLCKVDIDCLCEYIQSSFPSSGTSKSMGSIPCPYADTLRCKFRSNSESKYFLSVEEIEKVVCVLEDRSSIPPGRELVGNGNTMEEDSSSKINNANATMDFECFGGKSDCFCSQQRQRGEAFTDTNAGSSDKLLCLQCSCVVHYLCFTSYLRAVLVQIESVPMNAIECPLYYLWQQQNGFQKFHPSHPSISATDLRAVATLRAQIHEEDRRKLFYQRFKLPLIVDSFTTLSMSKSELPSSTISSHSFRDIECLSEDELLFLEQIVVGSVSESSVTNDPPEQKKISLSGLSSSSSEENKSRHATDAYICATTKTCPSCNMRATHYHGHACHHISPSGGCPSCGTHYCYKCQSTADENITMRGAENSCVCGFWSNFCGTFKNKQDIDLYLVAVPYPHDSRCGCAICPECKENSPCSLCNGHCDVCLGNINPGPQELIRNSWVAQSEDSRNRMAVDNILARLAALCVEQQLSELRAALDVELTNIDARDSSGKTLLHYASSSSGGNVGVIRMLIEEYHAKVDVRNSFGTTALHYACSNGYAEVVGYIIEHLYSNFCEDECHSTIHAQDNELKTPLFYASFRGHIDIVKLLLRVNKEDTNNTYYPIARRFCEIVDVTGWTALHCATFGGHTSVVDLLCNTLRVDVNILTEHGKSALHIAMEKGVVGIVRILVMDKRMEVNRPDNTKSTPLHYACHAGHEDCVRVLLLLSLRTVTLCIQNKFGKTCFHYACERGHVGIVQLLLAAARGEALTLKTVNARSIQGLTALEAAILSRSDGAATVQQLILFSPQGESYRSKLKDFQFMQLFLCAIRAFNWKVMVGLLRLLLRDRRKVWISTGGIATAGLLTYTCYCILRFVFIYLHYSQG